MIDIFLLTIFVSALVLFLSFVFSSRAIKKIKAHGQIKSFIATLESVSYAYLYKSYGFIIALSAGIAVVAFLFFSVESLIGFLIGTVVSVLFSYIGSTFFYRVVGRLQGSDDSIEKRFDLAFSASSMFSIAIFSVLLFMVSVFHFILPENMDIILGIAIGYSLSIFFIKKGSGVLQRSSLENIENTDISKKAISTISLLASKGINFGGVALDSMQSFLIYVGGVFLTISFLFDSLVDVYSFFLIACIVSLTSGVIISIVVRSYDLVSSVGSFYVTIMGSIIINALLFGGASWWLFEDVEIGNKAMVYVCILLGMLLSGVILSYYHYYTSKNFSPTRNAFKLSLKDSVSAFVSSLGFSMEGVALPSLLSGIIILSGYFILDIYGVLSVIIGFFMIMPVMVIFNLFSLLAPSIADLDEESEHGVVRFLKRTQNMSFYTSKGYGIFVGYVASVGMTFVLGHYILVQNNMRDLFLVDPIYFLSGLLIGSCCVFLFISVVFRSIITISDNIAERVNSYKINVASNNTEQFIWITNMMGRAIRRDSFYSLVLLFAFLPVMALVLGGQAVLGFVLGVLIFGFIISFLFLVVGFVWGNADNIIKEEGAEVKNSAFDQKTISSVSKATSILRDSVPEIGGVFVKTISSIAFLLIYII